MRLSILSVAFCMLCFSSVAFGQQAKLEGHVYQIINGRETPVAAIRIQSPSGQSQETDTNGHFILIFPATVQPGQATRVEINKEGWVIYEPLLGNCVTQSTVRNYEPLKVIIVEKRSPLALSPKRLSQVVSQWSSERVQLRGQVREQQRELDEYAFLREYADKYGFTLEQFRSAADIWALSKDSDDKEELALKEYWRKNYNDAARLAHEAGISTDDELDSSKKEWLEKSRKSIRRFQLEGNAYYEQLKFREALAAYAEIEKRFSTRKIVKEDVPEEWAETRLLLGNAKSALGIRVEGQESQLLLAEATRAYREALTVYKYESSPQQWAGTQNNLGVVLNSLGELATGEESRGLLREAIAAYGETLKIFTSEKYPQQWAATQINLGTALCFQGEHSEGTASKRLLEEAVAAANEALIVFTSEKFPQHWATAQNNLGMALMRQGERAEGEESIRLLREAVATYREALKVRRQGLFPQDWAATQNNLGMVLRLQGERIGGKESVRLLGEAIIAFREALKVRTRNALPQDWAMTKNNLGAALARQGEQLVDETSVLLLEEAVEAYQEALKVNTLEKFPQQWASIQTNLGNALVRIGERSRGKERVRRLFGEGVSAHREALKVYKQEQFPQQWASTQTNLGAALWLLGEWSEEGEKLQLLDEATMALRGALKIRTSDQFPQDWALTQNNLGAVLATRALMSEGEERLRLLREAVTAYREALKIRKREYFPQDWAATQNNLGKALALQGEWSIGKESVRLLGEAITAYRDVLKESSQEYFSAQWAMTQSNLARGLALQGERSTGDEKIRLLGEAVTTYREALKVYKRDALQENWAATQNNLGAVLTRLGDRREGKESVRLLGEAVTAFREALTIYERGPFPQQWALMQINLAKVYVILKNWRDAAVSFENVMALYPKYKEGYQSLTSIYHERVFEYEKAFELHQKWLSLFPKETAVSLDFAEAHFTTGRFAEFSQRIKPLLAAPELSVSTKTALQMIEVANLLALGNAAQVPDALTAISKSIAEQKADFRIGWLFNGTLHFINQHEKLAAHRAWLNRFFAIAEKENRDAILKALTEAQAQLSK